MDGSVFSDELRELADECFAPTLYACGDDLQAWARAALDIVGAGPVVLAGTSIGGSCAIEIARLAPQKVHGLILMGTKPGHRPEPALRDEAVRVIEKAGLRPAWERYWLPLFGPNTSTELLERAWRICEEQGAANVIAGVRAFHGRPDREGFILSWQGPTWVVTGDHDIQPGRARRLAERLPNASFHQVPDCGHYIPLEQPAALHRIITAAVKEL